VRDVSARGDYFSVLVTHRVAGDAAFGKKGRCSSGPRVMHERDERATRASMWALEGHQGQGADMKGTLEGKERRRKERHMRG